MEILTILLLVLFVVSSVLLVLIILIQDDQGDAMGGVFGGGGSATPFGSRAGNILTRTTSILAVLFIACAIGLAMIYKSSTPEKLTAPQEQTQEDLWTPKKDTAAPGSWDANNAPASGATAPAAPGTAPAAPAQAPASAPKTN